MYKTYSQIAKESSLEKAQQKLKQQIAAFDMLTPEDSSNADNQKSTITKLSEARKSSSPKPRTNPNPK